MITAISSEPGLSSTTNFSDYRDRPPMGERTILPDSTTGASRSAAAGDSGLVPKQERDGVVSPEPPQKDNSAMFVAAVISGALSPAPKSMEQLITRIGTSPIPEELEARLKDFLA